MTRALIFTALFFLGGAGSAVWHGAPLVGLGLGALSLICLILAFLVFANGWTCGRRS